MSKHIIENYLLPDKYPNVNANNDRNHYQSSCGFDNLIIEKTIEFNFREKRTIFTYNEKPYKSHDENAVISDCIFQSDVEIKSLNQNITFKNCTFEKKLSIGIKQKNLTDEEKNVPKGLQELDAVVLAIDNCTIHELHIKDATIKSKFYINKQSCENEKKVNIEKLFIKDTIFEENFKLHNCKVSVVEIEDTDFKKNADFFKSEFINGILKKNEEENIEDNYIGFKAINFEGLALFGDTIFHKKLIFEMLHLKGITILKVQY